MDFSELLTYFVLILITVNCSSGQMMSSMPGPPYPDSMGQNRWGVKFDPRLHGPSYDKTLVRNTPKDQSSYHTLPQTFQPPGPPVAQVYQPNALTYQHQHQRAAPGAYKSNAPAYPQNIPVYKPMPKLETFQQQPGSSTRYQPRHQSYQKRPSSPVLIAGMSSQSQFSKPRAVPSQNSQSYEKNKQLYNNWAVKNNVKNTKGEFGESVSPSQFKYAINFEYPRRPHHSLKSHHQTYSHSFKLPFQNSFKTHLSLPKGTGFHSSTPKFQVFTTLGKGLDVVTDGVSTAHKAVKHTTGSVIASSVKFGGKAAYIGSQVLAKVIKKVTDW